MAKRKRRKLYGAALAAHQKKVGRRKNAPQKAGAKRKYHKVRKYTVKRHAVKRHFVPKKRKSYTVPQHYSNPRRRRRSRKNPFSLGQTGSVAMEGLMSAGVILGTILAVGFVNRQLERFPVTQVGWGNIAGKLAIALAGGMAAGYLVRKGTLSKSMGYTVGGAAFAPLMLGAVAMLAPSIAAQVSLAADESDLMAQLEAPVREARETVRAELEAQLEDEDEEVESSLF